MSFRYPAGLITANSPVNANYPSGVWTPQQAYPYIANNVWGDDPYFNQTVLLLHGDGTNGAQNNTFLDSSTNNFTITRNGDTTQGTFSPFSLAAGEWSNYFDGTGDMLSSPSNAAFQYGTGDYTYEFWVYHTTLSGQQTYFSRNASGNFSGVYIYKDTSNFVGVYYSSQIATSSVTINANQWYYIVVSRLSGTLRIFIDGVQRASVSDTTNLTESIVRIGADGSTALLGFAGYISNARILKGVGYSSVTVPTTPLTNITNTSLLTCQSNRFVDNSTNAFAITRNGDVRVTPFSPFQPTQAYSPAVTGGSGYFDGNTDYLTVANTTALDLPGDFTVEFSVYLNSTADQTFIAKWAASNYAWAIQLFSGSLRFFPGNNGSITATSWSFSWSPTVSQWYSVALTRSGGSVRAYINGAQVGSTITETRNLTSTSLTSIGINLDGGGIQPVNGYVSNLRVLKGQALYTGATYTVPDAPLTTTGYGSTSQSITGTISLLLNFTNAGILDNTNKNVLETEADAQIDTSIVKYGTGAMEFDGTGDFLRGPYTENFSFGTGDFTVEMWINLSAAQSNFGLISTYLGSTTTAGYVFRLSSTGLRFVYRSGTTTDNIVDRTFSFSTRVWYFLTFVRSSGVYSVYVDGSLVGSTQSITTAINAETTAPFIVGASGASSEFMNGLIDDLRITKGIARYTANFIPPIARMPNQ
jgi:hypothetical protein